MGEAVGKIIDRLSAYEFLNNIIPGSIYVILVEKFTTFHIRTEDVGIDLVLCYFCGLVIGRIGSLMVESILIKIKVLKKTLYSEYVKSEAKDSKVRDLSTINNMYRTYSAVAICLLFTVGFSFIWTLIKKWILSRYIVIICGCLFLLLIFAKAYVKQTNYIAERIITINKLSEENKTEMSDKKKDLKK